MEEAGIKKEDQIHQIIAKRSKKNMAPENSNKCKVLIFCFRWMINCFQILLPWCTGGGGGREKVMQVKCSGNANQKPKEKFQDSEPRRPYLSFWLGRDEG